jgi:CysZ protein
MLTAAFKAFAQLFSPGFRWVLLKSLGLTIGMFVLVWFGVQALFQTFTMFSYEWLNTTISIIASLGLIAGMVFLIGPVSALFAGLFLDQIATQVEQRHYPSDPPGRDPPLARSLAVAAKFTVILVVVNILILLIALIPGVNILAFLAGNGYLLGREYFELVAMRHHPARDVRMLREEYSGRIFVGGLLIAFFAVIPFVNLLVPLFATAFMVHLYKATARDRVRRTTVDA